MSFQSHILQVNFHGVSFYLIKSCILVVFLFFCKKLVLILVLLKKHNYNTYNYFYFKIFTHFVNIIKRKVARRYMGNLIKKKKGKLLFIYKREPFLLYSLQSKLISICLSNAAQSRLAQNVLQRQKRLRHRLHKNKPPLNLGFKHVSVQLIINKKFS